MTRTPTFAIGFLVAAFLAASSAIAAKPNIIVIVADDLGYADLSFLPQAPDDVSTPALDRLAGEGTYFANAYSTAPICSPSRAGLITGRYQQRWGNYWYGQGGLPASEFTIPQALKPLGYSTQKIGKTHLNGGEAEHPLDHGFDEFLGFIHHTWDYIRLAWEDVEAYQEKAGRGKLGILNVGPLTRNRGDAMSYQPGSFTTTIFTDETLETIRESESDASPFYIQLEYNAVHMPTYVTHPDYAKKAGFEQPAWDPEADHWEFPFWEPAEMDWNTWHRKWGHLGEVDPLGRKRYLANLMALDDGIGRILETLDQTGQRDETVIVFLSDNGGTINTYSNNTPLRGYKYMFGEGGIRVPLIVSWPGKLPGNQRCQQLVSGMDVFPTLLELVGADVPDNLDGISLLAAIRNPNEARAHDHLCWSDGKGAEVTRQGPWKLIRSEGWTHSNYQLDEAGVARSAEDYTYPEGTLLFHLGDDVGETTDVAKANPDVVRRLGGLYTDWRAQMGKPRRGTKKNAPKKNAAKK